MDYQHYNFKDFVQDESFQQWVYHPDAQSNAFWESWLARNPEKRPVVDMARQFLLLLQRNETPLSDQQVAATLQNIHRRRQETPVVHMAPRTRRPLLQWAAAVLLLVATGVVAYLYFAPRDHFYATGNGEQEVIMLPDGSEVVLNANSTLRYPAHWHGQRDVYLEGEAFFSVRKLQHDTGAVKLIVHTPELAVEVLGTRFNVRSRDQRTRVVLEEGKVRLAADGEAMLMKPGELVEYAAQERFVKHTAEPRQYTAWVERELILENRTLGEVSTILEDIYGLRISIPDTAVANMPLYGSVYLGEADAILEILSLSYQLKIDRQEEHVTIRKKDQ
ncbi:ferric-dicitrate binding protein FerR, regulates iron transport through sigma-19 [Catalinimonas alkaloidigena]|uniref:Ferric-dicitrate binding protein FerR, regulates iron transport through sigma-19 n=1 Tax=Catalinimonas alkaloidigena TaxID=1075417 RepID=A0A1G9PE08_9BACT|nr:FecR domain-containing protein [Catalinimonas alkaloidigena]SDL96783.1 ferric-dicitrate binding protein FerR, regulates iron transport through sigma-19 [Catalinimonas alkaloidigena]